MSSQFYNLAKPNHNSIPTEKKEDAVKIGRELSRNAGSELVIHGKDGRIQQKDSHGNDHCPPRDKN